MKQPILIFCFAAHLFIGVAFGQSQSVDLQVETDAQKRVVDDVFQNGEYTPVEARSVIALAIRGCSAKVIKETCRLRSGVMNEVDVAVANASNSPVFKTDGNILRYRLDESLVENCPSPTCDWFHRAADLPDYESPIDYPWELQRTVEMVVRLHPDVLPNHTLEGLQSLIAEQLGLIRSTTDSDAQLLMALAKKRRMAYGDMDRAVAQHARDRRLDSAQLMEPTRRVGARKLEAQLQINLSSPMARIYFVTEKRFNRLVSTGGNMKFRPNAWNFIGSTGQAYSYSKTISPKRKSEKVVFMVYWPAKRESRLSHPQSLITYPADEDPSGSINVISLQ